MSIFGDDETTMKVQEAWDKWYAEGKDVFTEGDMKGKPKHPEYYYRLSNEWKGWSDWHGIDPSQKEYAEYAEQDRVEDMAFDVMWHGKFSFIL
jgi:hypothetical protein